MAAPQAVINASVNAQGSPNARNVKQLKIFRLLCEITVIKPPKFSRKPSSGFRAVHASIIHHRYTRSPIGWSWSLYHYYRHNYIFILDVLSDSDMLAV